MKKALFLTLILITQIAFARPIFCAEFLGDIKAKIFGFYPKPEPVNALTAGLEQANKLIKMTEMARKEMDGKSEAELKTLHLESYIPLAIDLISFLDATEKSMPIWKKWPSHTQLFSKFRNEISTRIENRQVTYEWLLVLSFRISKLGDRNLVWQDHDTATQFFLNSARYKQFLTDLSGSFGLSIPIPYDLGLFAINKLFANNVFPLGLIYKTVDVDGVTFSPFRFWEHDLDHAYNARYIPKEFIPYFQKYLKAAEQLPNEDRVKAEFVIYYLSHEIVHFFNARADEVRDVKKAIDRYKVALNMKNPTLITAEALLFAAMDKYNLGNTLLAAGVNIKSKFAVRKWLEEALVVFENLYTEAIK